VHLVEQLAAGIERGRVEVTRGHGENA
jgi:hypothetical protein